MFKNIFGNPWPARMPFYYGWVILVFAAIAMVATLPGRTVGIGLITEPLIADLGISRLHFAEMNFWAPIIGALFSAICGIAIDRFGVRAVLTAVLGALSAVVLQFSRVASAGMLLVLLILMRGIRAKRVVCREPDPCRQVVRAAVEHCHGHLCGPDEHRIFHRHRRRGRCGAQQRLARDVVGPRLDIDDRRGPVPDLCQARSRIPRPHYRRRGRGCPDDRLHPLPSTWDAVFLGLCRRQRALQFDHRRGIVAQSVDLGRTRVWRNRVSIRDGRVHGDRVIGQFSGRLGCAPLVLGQA